MLFVNFQDKDADNQRDEKLKLADFLEVSDKLNKG